MIEKAGTGILALLMTACSAYPVLAPPSPAVCRAVNVAVPDDATVTGQIVEYHLVSRDEIWEACGWQSGKGCAVLLSGKNYAIFVRDDGILTEREVARVRLEEECHALYEVAEHVLEDK